MDERTVRHVLLARYYVHLAADQLKLENEAAKFANINLLHEALETTLVICADHLNAKVPDRGVTIEVYLDRIDEKLGGSGLPFRTRILQFNRARVAAKHHLTLPEASFQTRFNTVVPEFIQEAIRLVFGKDLEDISLVDLIEDENIATHIRQAQEALASEKFYDCLIGARKAFYVQFEARCDIRRFENADEAKASGILALAASGAPHYARNPKYIRDRVTRPSDFIVFDYATLDSELMKEGVDVQTFWNIWRLTPEIYQGKDGTWQVEYDFDLADDPQIKENCVYVLDSLISITLQREARRKRSRSRTGRHRFVQTVANAPLYKKAMPGSEEAGRLPDGVRRVNISRVVPALHGRGRYWEASYMGKGGPLLFGYLHEDDAEGDPQVGFVMDGVDISGVISGTLQDKAEDVRDPN